MGLGFLLLIVGGIAMVLPPDREPDFTLENRFGDVVWNHELHSRMKGIPNCTVCHHTEQQGALYHRPCIECHAFPTNIESLMIPELFTTVKEVKYEGNHGPPPMIALHSSCKGCHVAMKKGPVACRDCHHQTFTGLHGIAQWNHTVHSRKLNMDEANQFADDCVVCHHKDEKAEFESEYRGCDSCHKPILELGLKTTTAFKNHRKAKHGQCQECHVEFNPEDDNISCVHCHKNLIVDRDLHQPTLEQAIHERCATCHNPDIVRSDSDMPGHCRDCHKPDPSHINIPEIGTIAWDHRRHGVFGGIDCGNCHHTEHADAPKIACDSCHGGNPEVELNLVQSLEKTCIECHIKENVGLSSIQSMVSDIIPDGYMHYEDETGSFWWDHRFHGNDTSLSCRDCHHNTIKFEGIYVTAEKTGKTWDDEAGHIKNCRDCHGEKGAVLGSIAEDTGAPALREAYGIICTKCHQKLGGGPQKWKDYFEDEEDLTSSRSDQTGDITL